MKPDQGPVGPPQNFLQDLKWTEVFHQLFLRGYCWESSAVELKRVVHWSAQMEALKPHLPPGAQGLGEIPTHVFGGYFYNFSTAVPSLAQIQKEVERGKKEGAKQFMVPTIREGEDVSSLKREGFLRLPSFVESVWERRQKIGLSEQLEQDVGNHRRRELERLHRKAQAIYELVDFSAEDLKSDPFVFSEVVRLHDLNIKKHGHPVNFYHAHVLDYLIRSPLAPYFKVWLRRHMRKGSYHQVLITLEHQPSQEMYYLVQGIDHHQVEPGQNLYIAALMDLYHHAHRRGIQRVYLGRGSHQEKASLGATDYHLLNHWILAKPTQHALIQKLATLTSQQLYHQSSPELRKKLGLALNPR